MSIQRFEVAFYAPCHEGDYDQYFAVLQDMKIEYVATGLSLPLVRDNEALDDMRRCAEKRGLQFVALHSPCGLLWEKSENNLPITKDVLNAAARLGARTTVWHFRYIHLNSPEISGGDRVNTKSLGDLDSMMASMLPEACDHAVQKGVEIVLENLPMFRWSRVSSEILEFIRNIDLPNLGFIIDSGHSHANDEDPAAVIRSAGPLLRDTHLHDNLGSRGFDFSQPGTQADITPSRDLHMIPGMGTINWMEVIRALREINYSFPIAFEGPRIKGHPDEDGLEQFSHCMRLTLEIWRTMEEAATWLPDPE